MIHPVLTLGLPMRLRRVGGARESLLSELEEGDDDLFCGRGILARGSIGNFAPGDVTVEVI